MKTHWARKATHSFGRGITLHRGIIATLRPQKHQTVIGAALGETGDDSLEEKQRATVGSKCYIRVESEAGGIGGIGGTGGSEVIGGKLRIGQHHKDKWVENNREIDFGAKRRAKHVNY
ncbi:hypothetical protein C8R45DRAFT_930289 [Mycena sanguinolenta]|nr:hypothetical protein C8R45DRAFT_930289 [Mycena sanguinolenta]